MKIKIGEKYSNISEWHIVQVGAGGTGSALTADLSRLIYSLKDTYTISYIISDGDTVEERNIMRQNFIYQDLNRNKAQVLAERYSKAYLIPIRYHDSYVLNEEVLMDLLMPPYNCWGLGTIILGCVDDHGARKVIDMAFEKMSSIIWIDGANEEYDGQVVVGYKQHGKVILPPVTMIYPEILESGPPKRSSVNCGTTVVEKPQSYAANKMVSTLMIQFLYNIMSLREIETHMATFDCKNIMVRPWYVSDLGKRSTVVA